MVSDEVDQKSIGMLRESDSQRLGGSAFIHSPPQRSDAQPGVAVREPKTLWQRLESSIAKPLLGIR